MAQRSFEMVSSITKSIASADVCYVSDSWLSIMLFVASLAVVTQCGNVTSVDRAEAVELL